MAAERVIPADDVLWITDNGALLCGRHLGMSAAFSGRDISGQKVVRATANDLHDLEVMIGHAVGCETCAAIAKSGGR